MGGSAAVIEAWRYDVPGIVQLWYPGVEGGHALADVLLGHANPSGHLPFSIPTDETHLPHWDPDADTEVYDLWHGHWMLAREGHPAAFPFGFGLSYTQFSIDAIDPIDPIDLAEVAGHSPAFVTVTVSNIGDRDGDTVVQIYGGLASSRFERPERRLVGFARVSLAAGESRQVDVPIDLRHLDVRIDGTWLREGGRYVLAAAQHAEDPDSVAIDLDLDEYVRSANGPAPERHQPPRDRDS
jgi:beta-glucosidase